MYKVVIADDEVLIRMYIREILENNGFEVVGEAEDGLDAITVCKQKHPDFVIMDVNMPVMTGLEAAQAGDMDVMGYIVKPVDEDTLMPAVKIALNNYRHWEEMKREFSRTREALDDRKYLDRAKGMIMDQKQLSEQDAYAYLRHLSMDKGISMTELAKMLLKAYEK